jgi:hypothetical protein
MLVELDIFSGRPNPRWQLDERTAGELRDRLGRLQRSTAPPPEPPGLGYRGFLWTEGPEGGRIYKGFVRVAKEVLSDSTLSIETLLLERMPAEFADLRKRVVSELQRRP